MFKTGVFSFYVGTQVELLLKSKQKIQTWIMFQHPWEAAQTHGQKTPHKGLMKESSLKTTIHTL